MRRIKLAINPYLKKSAFINMFLNSKLTIFMKYNMQQLYIYISSTSRSNLKRTGQVGLYWLIDIALTNQRSCISRDVP